MTAPDFASICLLALDVDGVLTPGDIIYTESGDELKIFNVKDGLGLSLAAREGLPVAIITARNSKIVERRMQELSVPYVFQGVKTKLPTLEKLVADLGLTMAQVAYMGDDLPDIPILQTVGLACCPADAVNAVKSISRWVSDYPGGKGAVRQLIDQLLAAHTSQAR